MWEYQKKLHRVRGLGKGSAERRLSVSFNHFTAKTHPVWCGPVTGHTLQRIAPQRPEKCSSGRFNHRNGHIELLQIGKVDQQNSHCPKGA